MQLLLHAVVAYMYMYEKLVPVIVSGRMSQMQELWYWPASFVSQYVCPTLGVSAYGQPAGETADHCSTVWYLAIYVVSRYLYVVVHLMFFALTS